MNSVEALERDAIQQLLGARNERILQLEQLLMNQRAHWESDALAWRRLERHRRDLGEWLVDAATDEAARLINGVIDAGLEGEPFIPCAFSCIENGRRYRFSLLSTKFEVTETQ